MAHNAGLLIYPCLISYVIMMALISIKLVHGQIPLNNGHNSSNQSTIHVEKTESHESGAHLAGGQWSYNWEDEELHPDKWSTFYSSCAGKRQSPVEIRTNSSLADGRLTALRLVDYDDTPTNDQWLLTNNGHTVQLTANFRSAPQLQGGGLPGKYTFKQLHFHWGANDTTGSEHVIDGKYFPLEVHIVHQRKNETDAEAATDEVGLAVLGIVFEITQNSSEVHPILKSIISEIRKISQPDSRIISTIPNFTLVDLCPRNLSYVRYLGSLTTPPCSETVVWTVLTTPQKITEDLLTVLRSVWAHVKTSQSGPETSVQGVHLLDNFRPIQPLNLRIMRSYVEPAGGVYQVENVQRFAQPTNHNTSDFSTKKVEATTSTKFDSNHKGNSNPTTTTTKKSELKSHPKNCSIFRNISISNLLIAVLLSACVVKNM